MMWNIFLSPEFKTKFYKEVSHSFLKIHKFPYNTMQDKSDQASVPETSSFCPAISIKYRLLTDRQTYRQRQKLILCYNSITQVKIVI